MAEELEGRVGAFPGADGAAFWVETSNGTQPLEIPPGWRVERGPLRLIDPEGVVRVQASDRVRMNPMDPSSVTAIEILDRQDLPIRHAHAALSDDGHGARFVDNLRRVLRSWRLAPLLPLLSLTFTAITSLPSWFVPRPAGCGVDSTCRSGSPTTYVLLTVLTIPVLVAQLGYLGAERAWYADLYRGDSRYPSWVLGQIWHYVGRFVRLGLLVVVFLFPIELVLRQLTHGASQLAAVAVLSVLVDIVLTFVPPALTFDTHSAVRALRLGWRELKGGLPGDLPYLLIPPLALSIVLRLQPGLGSASTEALVAIGAQALTLLFAGATTFRYLQQAVPVQSANLEPSAPR